MPQSGQPAVLVANFAMTPATPFDRHVHAKHQLAWARRGILTVGTDTAEWVLPATRALWIPAGVPHEVGASGNALMRTLYVSRAHCPIHWDRPTAVEASPLLAELISRLDDPALPARPRRRTEAVLFDVLTPVAVAAVRVPMPRDARAADVARRLLADPADGRNLAQWGWLVGASERTLARLFQRDTNVPFGRWRTLARISAALPPLAAGEPVGRVAVRVGYQNASAFVAAFRRETGMTPGGYFGRQGSA
jgi:AraC-like DNA-binding protein/quercetin dioxygenase-like cupin family protein